MSSIRPFTYDNLPRFSREQLTILQSVEQYISTRPFDEGFEESLSEVVESVLKSPCKLSKPKISTLTTAELQASFADVEHIVVLGAGSEHHKILVELDPSLVGLSIERILGGSGEGDRGKRPLTDLEEGVLSFGVLKVLQHFQGSWEHASQLSLSLDRFVSLSGELDEALLGGAHYYSIGFRMEVGGRLMRLRIILPDALLVNSVFTEPDQGPSASDKRAYSKRLLRSLGERSVDATIEVATLNLNASDVATLEAGDIIIIENHQLVFTPEGIGGSVFVRIGSGENGGLRCQMLQNGAQQRLQIKDIIIQEKPAETAGVQAMDEAMTDVEQSEETEQPQEPESAEDIEEAEDTEETGHTEELEDKDEFEDNDEAAAASPAEDSPAEEEDNLEETEGLLRDVDAPIVVELGRLEMNTAQIIRLKTGQILRLPRAASDPVDLVVNNKVFAKGELIEVDGELGVRLVHVTGA
jgi:flagellar motor switch protein FliM